MPRADVVAAALALLEGSEALDRRPLCPSCTRNAQRTDLGVCSDCHARREGRPTSAERKLAAKRGWWEQTGTHQRRERRVAAA